MFSKFMFSKKFRPADYIFHLKFSNYHSKSFEVGIVYFLDSDIDLSSFEVKLFDIGRIHSTDLAVIIK